MFFHCINIYIFTFLCICLGQYWGGCICIITFFSIIFHMHFYGRCQKLSSVICCNHVHGSARKPCINCVCPAAFWDATRAFMLLSVLSCFAGVLLGITASKRPRSRQVRSGGIALLLSGQKHTHNTSHTLLLLGLCEKQQKHVGQY